jgi:hypothetical protein
VSGAAARRGLPCEGIHELFAFLVVVAPSLAVVQTSIVVVSTALSKRARVGVELVAL